VAESADGTPWVCACGETDINKHDLGMAIAHLYGMPEEKGREILLNIRETILGPEQETET
jgi:hypothetical protein